MFKRLTLRRQRAAPPYRPTATDRIGWRICRFANAAECECAKARSRCCEAVERCARGCIELMEVDTPSDRPVSQSGGAA